MADLINQIRDFLLSDSYLGQRMEQVQLRDGQVLFEQGDDEAAFYVIKKGQIRIHQCDRQGTETASNFLKVGDSLGQLALIDDQPYAVTAVSLGPSSLLRLQRHHFLQRVYQSPQLNQLLIQLGNQRLRYLIQYIKRLESWINLVAQSQCDTVIEEIETFNLQGNGLAHLDYLAGIFSTVADSFKHIVETVKQLKGNQCQLEETITLELGDETESEMKLNLQLDENRQQQEVEQIVHTDYFDYLIQLAERRNTVSHTENLRTSQADSLSLEQSEIDLNAQVISLQNPEIKQALIRGLKSRSDVFNRLILKAWEDEGFKQKLLTNPREVYAQEFGHKLPENLTLEILEETLDAIKIVLPINPFLKIPEEELSEDLLDAIAGGNWNISHQEIDFKKTL
ncbi:MAG: NHLP leader peptide family RiPP precursor [Crocosphaera sp.]|nr:NHLP leader peptide family RiPP precursor [Crocosphaera sp.]